jgi:hypothetical protein
MSHQIIKLITDATTTAVGTSKQAFESPRTYDAKVVGTGAVTATIVIDVSNDSQAEEANIVWEDTPLGTITLSGTTSSSEGFGSIVPWLMTRARVTAISGTGATVNVTMAV